MFATRMLPEIDAHTLADWMAGREPLVILDVREQPEWALARLRDTRVLFLPLSSLARQGLPDSVVRFEGRVVVMCHIGERSAVMTAWLNQLIGLPNVYNLAGGIDAYAREIDPSVGRY